MSKENRDIINKIRSLNLTDGSYPPLENLYLIGSRSRNTNRPDSDIDLLAKFKGVELLSMEDVNNSIFHFKYRDEVIDKINKTLDGKYEIQLVGAYELRFFNWDENYTNIELKGGKK